MITIKIMFQKKIFCDIDTTVSLLGLYGYKNDKGKFIAFPLRKDDPGVCDALLKALERFTHEQSNAQIRSNAREIITDTGDKRWSYAIHMFGQILKHLHSRRSQLAIDQKTAVDIALVEWMTKMKTMP